MSVPAPAALLGFPRGSLGQGGRDGPRAPSPHTQVAVARWPLPMEVCPETREATQSRVPGPLHRGGLGSKCVLQGTAPSSARGPRSPRPGLGAPSQAGRAELRAPSHSPGPPGASARGPPVRLTLPPSAPHGRVGVPRAARLCVSSGFLHRPCSAWEAGRTSAGRPQPRKLSVGARGPWGGSSARDVLCSPGTAVSDAAREPRRARPEGTALGSPGSFCVRAGRPGGRPRSQAPRGGWRGHRSLAVGSSFPAHVLAFFFFFRSFNDSR